MRIDHGQKCTKISDKNIGKILCHDDYMNFQNGNLWILIKNRKNNENMHK